MPSKLLLAMWFLAGVSVTLATVSLTLRQANVWNCSAEDEVVIIDNTCVHIDELNRGIYEN